ncbi:hypothetical protein AA101099_3061 [Neoasaia chiangmaiensis NBRC 101099]|uniref:Uncharacterized protein n=1 Tax=Neoasaia chiangmaiensis TaxID=320497 RepID=A0A1U9KNH5_9PROT|nr:hypothetical protein [Neoasaia chiangmaiensis]AQS87357.1 hypothetical protein A0U93_04735 [Neoasaia chiangmaiensis]GBR43003.1 hypothetical protein AA101099_3061 [Neoasaia chiangmaiensis NBRC 101099]GEN16117.1 hypothetical protein NCH01_25480 [Neoasaia chiangmaiensis]
MRKAALLILPIVLSGCSGFGKFLHDTATLPGENPNGPSGDSENLERARGHDVQAMPILAQPGNIWPGAPQPLPTLRDVENSHGGIAASLGDPNTYYGNMTEGGSLGQDGQQMPEGKSISAGETDDMRHGVHDFSGAGIPSTPELPSTVPDNARHYGATPRKDTIVIPNGDGTSTFIAPDGTVSVRKDGAAPQH